MVSVTPRPRFTPSTHWIGGWVRIKLSGNVSQPFLVGEPLLEHRKTVTLPQPTLINITFIARYLFLSSTLNA
jgi:hypothetical protein